MRTARHDRVPTTAPRRHYRMVSAWAAAHALTWRWCGAVLVAWAAVSLFAAITVPIKYPYEALGTVVDSGVIAGIVIPVIVSCTVLYEGPRDLIGSAARRLIVPRIALVSGIYVLTSAAAVVTAVIASLPVVIVTVDAMLFVALCALGVSLLGVGLGWLLPVVFAFVFSAPGLVPWEYNVIYQRDVSNAYLALVAGALIAGMGAYASQGSRDRMVDRSVQG
ncbi:hypothetical protein [Nocardioides lacusdianchii]|uniref:hypothetical protein n=1 Tax=Nocardioides lacusdianchii TaxID=2783664 RepID=UPI001CC9E579|nr:hypothetical protein [Nocardioides lacusdianchii]